MNSASGTIRVGIGGWSFEGWRGTFYPPALARKRELEYASRRLTSIEINSTYYGPQKPESFRKWREETPENFIFSVKGPRAATMRRVLADSAATIERFFAGGVLELRQKLGPVNWQFPPHRPYERAQIEQFLTLLPMRLDGRAIRHAIEVRHLSFRTPEFVELLRAHGVGIVLTDKAGFPHIADLTAPFVYARLQCASPEAPSGYAEAELDLWADRARLWSAGQAPSDLAPLQAPAEKKPRDVFVYVINGFKPRAPAAAMALLERLQGMAEG